MAGYCEHGSEPSSFIRCGIYLPAEEVVALGLCSMEIIIQIASPPFLILFHKLEYRGSSRYSIGVIW